MSDISRYKLIKGNFYIFYPDLPRSGPEPDGDTITFKPDNLDFVKSLKSFGRKQSPGLNARKMVKIRFEGIDALESHFPLGNGENVHQNLTLAYNARDYMLDKLGFKDIKYREDNPNKVESVNGNPCPGYILANGIDSFGRVIAFVFHGNTGEVDGSNYFVKSSNIQESINYKLLKEGLVYSTLYSSLPVELIEFIEDETRRVRAESIGLWNSEDVNTKKWGQIDNMISLEDMVIWPKLFRRISKYFSEGYEGLNGFIGWLREDPLGRDDRLILPNREIGNLHDLFIIENNRIKLNYEPEEIIFLPNE